MHVVDKNTHFAELLSGEDAYFKLQLLCMCTLSTGCLARKLDQCSAFGAWLDVFIDNFARGATWVLAAPRLGMFVVAVEWTVFCFTAAVSAEWKHKCFHSAPWFVKRLMSNNFINPIGIIAIAGLHFLPALQYVHHVCETPALKAAAVCSVYEALGYPLWIILVTGRLFCLFSECWVISRSLMAMLDTDAQRFTD